MELHFYAAIIIGVNFFTPGADNDRGLTSLHKRLRRHAPGAERHRKRDAFEAVTVRQFIATACAHSISTALSSSVAHRSQQPGLVHILPIMILQRKLETTAEAAARSCTLADFCGSALF